MKLSTKGRYGLRALIDLAQHGGEGPVSITSIAERQEISERYLEQLMSKLKKAGIIQSIRGAQGGYVLAKELEEVSVGEVLRALEGDLNPVECSGFLLEGGCQAADNCVTKYVWQRINDSINQTVDEMNLKALVEVGENLKESKVDQTVFPIETAENKQKEKEHEQTDLFRQCGNNENCTGSSRCNDSVLYRALWQSIQCV